MPNRAPISPLPSDGFAANAPVSSHYRIPAQHPFSRADRDRVTVVFGGVTPAHERLLKLLLERRGFRVDILPTPTLDDYSAGRRYANSGFCNPLYFTSGSLINYLRRKESQGITRQEVAASHVFLTTSSAGPCRLGLYQQEYRSVIANAGYPGLRVVAFEDALSFKGDDDEGMSFGIGFYYDLLTAVMVGDLLNDLYYRTLPYEVVEGSTERAWNRALEIAESRSRKPSRGARVLQRLPRSLLTACAVASRALAWILDPHLIRLVVLMRREFRRVDTDPSRVVPCVKLIGEFWAQTTQGDGNYRAQRFLHEHGAEVSIEPISTWVMYLLFEAALGARSTLRKIWFGVDSLRAFALGALRSVPPVATLAVLGIAGMLYRGRYNLLRLFFNNVPDRIPWIGRLARLAAPYYDPHLIGGESHMEIGKTLLHTLERRVHMVISVKPFGCLPSTMSDGVQPLVRAHYPSTLFLSIETSSEGSTHAQSRMLMVLSEARERAREEFNKATTTRQVSRRALAHRLRRRHALQKVRGSGAAARAARAVMGRSARAVHGRDAA